MTHLSFPKENAHLDPRGAQAPSGAWVSAGIQAAQDAPVNPQEGLARPESSALPEFTRLVVLIPDTEFDEIRLGRKLWSLIPRSRGAQVLLVALVTSAGYQPEVQRRLIHLAAVISDACVQINTQSFKGRSWEEVLQSVVQPGDVILSHAGLVGKSRGRKNVPLEAVLTETLKTPVVSLSGFFTPRQSHPYRHILVQGLFWVALIAIFAGSFVIENDIGRATTGWIRDLLLVMVVVFEMALIYSWNSVKG